MHVIKIENDHMALYALTAPILTRDFIQNHNQKKKTKTNKQTNNCEGRKLDIIIAHLEVNETSLILHI